MVAGVVFFLLLVTTGSKATCHDRQSTGSGVLDLQQVTTIPYCFFDECTIKRTDTGQQLDIIYTTDSLLIVTLTGNQTSMVISKDEDQPVCPSDDVDNNLGPLIGQIGTATLLGILSGTIIAMHLLFKELRNPFGNLMIYYNLALCVELVGFIALSLTHFQIAPKSQMTCQSIFFVFMQGYMGHEGMATCILAYLAYIVYYSYKLRAISESDYKKLLKYYLIYTIGTVGLFDFFVVSYDLATGNGAHTILPSGHCMFLGQDYDVTMKIPQAYAAFNKTAQIVFFVIYLVYYYKFNAESSDDPGSSRQHTKVNRQLFMIAIAMGATIGVSQFIWLLKIFGNVYINGILGAFILLIQQSIIMFSVLCKKMVKVCKNKFQKETSP